MAEIFVVFASGMLHPVAGNPGVGATLCRADGGYRNVLFLPANFTSQLLAGNRLCLVLSLDGFFCSLAGLAHRLAGLLAALAFPGG